MPENELPFIQSTVRFRAAEYEQIKLAAERRGMSINSFVSMVCFCAAEKMLSEASPEDEFRRIVNATEFRQRSKN